MIRLLNITNWNPRQFTCALLLAATTVLVSAESNPVCAGWFSLPGSQKSKEPSSTTGFTATIRKLLKDAQSAEEKGDLDQAIALAQQAHEISENSSTIVKSSREVSPAVTKAYLDRLERKNATLAGKELPPRNKKSSARSEPGGDETVTIKRRKWFGLKEVETQVRIPTDSKVVKGSETNRGDSPKSKKTDIRQVDASTDEDAVAPKRSDRVNRAAAVEAVNRMAVPARPVLKPSNNDPSQAKSAANKPFSPLPSEEDEQDPFADPEPAKPAKSEPSADAGKTQIRSINDLLNDHILADEAPAVVVNPMPSYPPKEEANPIRTVGSSARMKLRSRYGADEDAGLVQSAVAQSPAADEMPTIINPRDSLPPRREEPLPPMALTPDNEQTAIQPIASEEVGHAAVTMTDLVPVPIPTTIEDDKPGIAMISAPEEIEIEPEQVTADSQEKEATLASTPIEPKFQTESVLELKRRLDSVTSLQPGELTPVFRDDLLSDAFKGLTEETATESVQVIRLRRKKPYYRDLPADWNQPAKVETLEAMKDAPELKSQPEEIKPHNSVGTSSVSRSAMIQWRSAKEHSAAASSLRKSDSTLPADLRQALRDSSEPVIASPSLTMNSPIFAPPNVGQLPTANDDSNGGEDRSPKPPEWSTSGLAARLANVSDSVRDNTTASSIEGYSGSIAGSADDSHSANANPFRNANLDTAPLPPAAGVEQTSFDTPDELFRRRQSKTRIDSASSTDESPFPSFTRLSKAGPLPPDMNEADSDLASADQLEGSHQVNLLSGPLERLAYLFGCSPSTVLAAISVLMFAAAVWMVRSLTRP